MITNAIHRAISKKQERNYPLTYWAIDLHATIIKPTYFKPIFGEKYAFYNNAIDVLQWLSELPNQILILWTSTNDRDVNYIIKDFENKRIYFNYINENPECSSSALSCFDNKFYFDILLDDKAGFDPKHDWGIVHNTLTKFKEFKRIRKFYSTDSIRTKLHHKFPDLKFITKDNGYGIKITIPKPKYVNHISVHLISTFYKELEKFLTEELQITAPISYNNDKTTFYAWYDCNTSAFTN